MPIFDDIVSGSLPVAGAIAALDGFPIFEPSTRLESWSIDAAISAALPLSGGCLDDYTRADAVVGSLGLTGDANDWDPIFGTLVLDGAVVDALDHSSIPGLASFFLDGVAVTYRQPRGVPHLRAIPVTLVTKTITSTDSSFDGSLTTTDQAISVA